MLDGAHSVSFDRLTIGRELVARSCFALFSVAFCLPSIGCGGTDEETTPEPAEAAAAENAKPKATDDIGEFDPNAGKEIVDSTVEVSGNPLTYALEARESALEQVAHLPVMQAVNLFHATEGRYPKDHDEFMTKVIKANNIKLPPLTAGKRYEYDVENHTLVIVKDAAAE